MPRFRTGVVTAVKEVRRGLQKVDVDGEPACVLTELVGSVAPGDRVVVNVTAVDLGLGTGGVHFVHWNLERDDLVLPGGGHVMKLRYTSLQADTGVAEEHEEIPDEIGACPVVVTALHSQLAPVAAAVKLRSSGLRVVYVMTDAAALPIALSDLVHGLCAAGLVDATVTAGHAFGGDREAVNVRTALGIAVNRLSASVVVVGMGPGSVGTATARGFSGLEVAGVLDTVAAAGGRPIAALRFSDADGRVRHQGISHHSRTALADASTRVELPYPSGEPPPDMGDRHIRVAVEVPDVTAHLETVGVEVRTMGRGAVDDPRFFTYAAAAGAHAARVASQDG